MYILMILFPKCIPFFVAGTATPKIRSVPAVFVFSRGKHLPPQKFPHGHNLRVANVQISRRLGWKARAQPGGKRDTWDDY